MSTRPCGIGAWLIVLAGCEVRGWHPDTPDVYRPDSGSDMLTRDVGDADRSEDSATLATDGLRDGAGDSSSHVPDLPMAGFIDQAWDGGTPQESGVPDSPLDAPETIDALQATDGSGDLSSRTACRTHSVRAVGPVPIAGNDAGAPACVVGEDGSLTISYRTDLCPNQRPFRGCDLSQHEDMSSFESGKGLWQVRICSDALVQDTINLWYEPEANQRKYLNLLLPAAEDGCRIMFLSPWDACGAKDQCGPTCLAGDGGAPSPDEACASYANSKLVLMSEWCHCPAEGCAGPTKTTVKLLSLSYFSEGCLCETDADCAESGTTCRKDAWPLGARCQSEPDGCRGVCLP